MLLVIVLVLIAVVGVTIYLLTRPSPTKASPATVTLARSINLRLTDLPSGWAQSNSNTPVPAPASVTKVAGAQRTLAACLGIPPVALPGWLGVGSSQDQVVHVRSPVFATATVPTVQMTSVTSVSATTADGRQLAAAVASRKFVACFGQYQVAAVSLPATAQVQTVSLSAPDGVEAYGYVTTFTLPAVGRQFVGDAFIIGGSVVTLLKASTSGPAIPSADFNRAYHAVVGRVAKAK